MNFKIEELNKDEILDLYEVEKTSLNEVLSFTNLSYEVNENPVSKFLVIKDLDINKIVSYIDYWITFDSATIFKIVTHKDYRNKGLAKLLLDEVINELKKEEVLYLTLEVRVSNEAAIKLYKSFNFKEIVKKEHYYSDGEDAIYMVRGIYE